MQGLTSKPRLSIPSNMVVVTFNAEDGIVTFVSHSDCPISGYHRDEIVGHSIGLLFPDSFDHNYLRNISAYFSISSSEDLAFNERVMLRSKSAQKVYVSADLVPLYSENGDLTGYQVSLERLSDTPLLDSVQAIALNTNASGITERLKKALQFAGINLFKIDAQTGEGSFIYSATGQSTFLKPDLWLQLVEPEYRDLVAKSHERPGPAIEYAYRPNGPDMPARWLSQAIIDQYRLPDGRLEKLGFSRDITKEKRYAEQLQSLDKRTGGITPEALQSVFSDLVAADSEQRFSFYAVELIAYDTTRCERHGISDSEILKAIYRKLFDFLQTEGSIAGSSLSRAGFLMLVHEKMSEPLGEYLATLCDVPLYINDTALSYSIRYVRTDYPTDAASFDSILVNLRYTLARSARENKSFRRFLHTDTDGENLNGVEYIGDIESAFEENQFKLLLQPKVESQSPHRIVGAEALLRWEHPREGLLSPDKFLDILVNTHWRKRTAVWVLQHAAELLCQIQEIDQQQSLAVNLTAYDLCDLDVLSELCRLVNQAKFAPETMIIELSESQTHLMPEVLIRSIQAVNELGLTLALDDFGQEMSSLGYLVNLPLNQIKIDKVFLDEAMDVEASNLVISFATDFAALKGWSTVVEGVESADQAARVLSLGVDELQGFYFGAPLEPENFVARLKQQTKILER